MEHTKFQIEVEKILQSKMKNKAQKPSRILVYLLKKLIHQDRINGFLSTCEGLNGYEFFKETIKFLNIHLVVHNKEYLDPNKKYIFASNHPLGGIDGVSLGATIGDMYHGKICYILNDLLLNLPNLKDISVPINKVGNLSRDTGSRIKEALDSDSQMIIFPAGMCSRLQQGQIKDLVWKKNFIFSAQSSQRDIVPIFFEGRNSRKFYLIAKLREKLGIKMNYEMILLPHEMFGNTGKTFHIYFGKPIPWQTFNDKSKTAMQWAAYVKEEVYKIKR